MKQTLYKKTFLSTSNANIDNIKIVIVQYLMYCIVKEIKMLRCYSFMKTNKLIPVSGKFAVQTVL